MTQQYKYEVAGTTGDGNTWTTTGEITISPGDFVSALTRVMRLSFEQLTQGKAVFGTPGMGCRGPYEITRYSLEVIVQ